MELRCRCLYRSCLIHSRALCQSILGPVNLRHIRTPVSPVPLWRKTSSTTDIIAKYPRCDSSSGTGVRLPRGNTPCASVLWKNNFIISPPERSESTCDGRWWHANVDFPAVDFQSSLRYLHRDGIRLEHYGGAKPPSNGAAVVEEVSGNTNGIYCSSILKKRRKKMNRHKYRKWRKRMRFLRRSLKK